MENLNFGQALEALKQGKKVARQGWNGKNMYIYIEKGPINAAYVLKEESSGEPIPTHINSIPINLFKPMAGDLVTVNPYVCMWTSQNSIVKGWLASQTDMLAEDWNIIN